MDQSPKNETLIKHTVGWSALDLQSLWEYRHLLYLFTWREIKGRYRQMALGPLWIILVPLIQMVMFSCVFGSFVKISSDGLPYSIFSYTGLLPWQIFSLGVSQATGSLVKNKSMISKVYFPRLIIPISTTLPTLVDFGMSFGILLGMMFYYGFVPGIRILMLPVYLLLATASALVIGLWLAAMAVIFNDIIVGISYLVQIFFYATPIVYPLSTVPPRWQALYLLNPMTHVIEGFRWALLGKGREPDLLLAVMFVAVFALLIPAAYCFRRIERSIIDMA